MRRIVARGHLALKENTVFAGVDLGMDQSAVSVVTERGQCLGRFRFGTDQEGYAYFRDELD